VTKDWSDNRNLSLSLTLEKAVNHLNRVINKTDHVAGDDILVEHSSFSETGVRITPQLRTDARAYGDGILGHQFDKSLLLQAIHSHFYWRILNKTSLFSGFK
jgi:hypothetical protein